MQMKLSDAKLVRINIINGVVLETTCKIPCRSEEDIFRALGIPFKAPTERNCYDGEPSCLVIPSSL